MSLFDKIENILDQRLISGAEFNNLLEQLVADSNIDLSGIQYVCTQMEGGESFVYGHEGTHGQKSENPTKLENDIHVTVLLWSEKGVTAEYIQQATELFRKFWNEDCTNNISRIMSSSKEKVQKKCEETLTWNAREHKKTAVFMMDLDGFGEVNKCELQAAGDHVILEFANVLLEVNRSRGILIHRSGDEFYLLYTYETPSDVLQLAWDIHSALDAHTFQKAGKKLTVSMGIQLLEDGETDFCEATNKANSLYNPTHRNQDKQRDSIRIAKQENNLVSGPAHYFESAASRVLANIFHDQVFHNIYLDYLSDVLCHNEQLDGLQERIRAFLRWINYSEGDTLRCCTGGADWDTKESLSAVEIGLAIFHGLLNNPNLSSKIVCADFGTGTDKLLRVTVDDALVYQSESEVDYQKKLCKRVPAPAQRSQSDRDIAKRIVLLQSGYEANVFPDDIFYKVVKVDSRPYTGGGLPDLWSAALCSLISAMKENPNFKDIVIYGETGNTQEIEDYLTHLEKWGSGDSKFSYDYITRKTFQSDSDIRMLQQKFQHHVELAKSEEQLRTFIYDRYNADDLDYTVTLQTQLTKPVRPLKRTLDFKGVQLSAYAGCVAGSLQDAFPLVLEILRTKYQTQEFPRAIDQAGRELLELTDFKIMLTKPKETDFPDYYRDEIDRQKMRKYYEHEFHNEKEGLFRRPMERDGQLQSMLQHVAEAINNRYTTRRAILVVPAVSEKGNYSPLGLVSVWLCPRFNETENNVVIDFSYTWRTVEALTGLPYSLYASVNFSSYLTKEVEKQLEKHHSDLPVRMGQISYIAYSLHMFLDKDSMNIVRGIVNEASV